MELDLPKNYIAAAHVCACNPRKLKHYPVDWWARKIYEYRFIITSTHAQGSCELCSHSRYSSLRASPPCWWKYPSSIQSAEFGNCGPESIRSTLRSNCSLSIDTWQNRRILVPRSRPSDSFLQGTMETNPVVLQRPKNAALHTPWRMERRRDTMPPLYPSRQTLAVKNHTCRARGATWSGKWMVVGSVRQVGCHSKSNGSRGISAGLVERGQSS